MIAAAAQKYFTLRLRPGLITDGMFRYVRHPNYLGEMMVYGSFAMMIWHWVPFVVLAWVWIGSFAVNIDSRKPAYRVILTGNNTSDTHGYCWPWSFSGTNAPSTKTIRLPARCPGGHCRHATLFPSLEKGAISSPLRSTEKSSECFVVARRQVV